MSVFTSLQCTTFNVCNRVPSLKVQKKSVVKTCFYIFYFLYMYVVPQGMTYIYLLTYACHALGVTYIYVQKIKKNTKLYF